MRLRVLALFLLLLAAFPASAQQRAEAAGGEFAAAVDRLAEESLAATGVPSASVAVVRDGRIAYVKAYGRARLEPATPAAPGMRYAIGSISKQFTAVALLLLQEEGKLSLDDKVGRYLPQLTRANDVTIRQLLSMTAGYQDYWPQDYVIPVMRKPGAPQRILQEWGQKPLDFEPGTKYQYSNTNYVIAGLIFEKVAKQDLFGFLAQRVFRPLGMTSVIDVDQQRLAPTDAAGYQRFALGPPRPAPEAAFGWLFAAGGLAMTAEDLARWNIAVIERKVLKPASWAQLEREVLLESGVGVNYALGLVVAMSGGRRVVAHDGEISGFVASNAVFPEQRVAVTVLTNQDASGAAERIAHGMAGLLFAESDPATAAATERARHVFRDLQQGKIDRAEFTANANAYFTEQAVQDFAASLGPLGEPREFVATSRSERGGMIRRAYRVACGEKRLYVWTFELPGGRLEQFQVRPAE